MYFISTTGSLNSDTDTCNTYNFIILRLPFFISKMIVPYKDNFFLQLFFMIFVLPVV